MKSDAISTPEKAGVLVTVSTTAMLILMLLPGYVLVLTVLVRHGCRVLLAVQFGLQKQALRDGDAKSTGTPTDVFCRSILVTLRNWTTEDSNLSVASSGLMSTSPQSVKTMLARVMSVEERKVSFCCIVFSSMQ